MKRSKSSISILVTALSLSMIFVASAFTARSTAAARVRAGAAVGSVTPVKGIDVVVLKNPGNSASRQTQTDAEGSFSVAGSDITPGTYTVSLVCNARCQSLNDLSVGSIQFTLAGAKESPFKRNITKQQLVAGVKFPFEIGKESRALKGIVSLLK